MTTPGSRMQGDEAALRRIGQRLSCAPTAPWLHDEVARRMAERLPLLAAAAASWIDWWPSIGGTAAGPRSVWPGARRLDVDVAAGASDRVPTLRGWRHWLDFPRRSVGERHVGRAPADVQVDLLWANMGLHLAPDPSAVLAHWHEVLRRDGVLMLSTLGPGTLAELQSIYDQAGWGPALSPFEDMHDLGDRLVATGFADPVIDQETLTLHWSSPQALLAELRGLGGNAHGRRHAGLRTRRWREQLQAALARSVDSSGRIAMRFEVVYAQAFKAPTRLPAGETRVDPEELRRQLRLRRSTGNGPGG